VSPPRCCPSTIRSTIPGCRGRPRAVFGERSASGRAHHGEGRGILGIKSVLAPRWRRCLAEHALRVPGQVVERLLEPVKASRATVVGGGADLRRRLLAVDRWWRCRAVHAVGAADRVVERLESVGARIVFGFAFMCHAVCMGFGSSQRGSGDQKRWGSERIRVLFQTRECIVSDKG